MKTIRYAAIFTLTLCLVLLLLSGPVQANHLDYLPLVPNTSLMKSVKATQEQVWCVDARAQNYPGFVTQLRDVNDQYAVRTGIRNRQVEFTDPACQVRHTMPDNHQCSGCAAWVFYTNWPVTIEYKWQVGYTDWRTTQGHELGHALLGLHEQYQDSGGSIICLPQRTDTVMSCGTGVRYPMPRDVNLGCAVLITSWCGKDGTIIDCGSGDPYYDLCDSSWHFSAATCPIDDAGTPFACRWSPSPAPYGRWFGPGDALLWEVCDPAWNGRHTSLLEPGWFHVGQGFYVDRLRAWTYAPPC